MYTAAAFKEVQISSVMDCNAQMVSLSLQNISFKLKVFRLFPKLLATACADSTRQGMNTSKRVKELVLQL